MSKKLWGGRFGKKTDPLVEEFTRSIGYDCELAEYDIKGSLEHVRILKKAGYLSGAEAARLTNALVSLKRQAKSGRLKYDPSAEDIHTQIQTMLEKGAGAVALKLQTARSRNEQVAYATKLYCIDAAEGIEKAIEGLKRSLQKTAANNSAILIPGLTHMQHAQPISLKAYLSAYAAMLERDSSRFSFIHKMIKPTMGAGALAGTPIAASKYGRKAVSNSIDAVSDRDFVIEMLSAAAILGMHLSRLAEDLIIWSTKEFDFVEIDEAFCTGSSLMPQKKNADTLEMVRGYTGRLYGNLLSVLTVMKGLPLSYNRDMQLDKEPLFESVSIISLELAILARLVGSLKFNKDKIMEHLNDESLYATDLVYYLVEKKIPFSKAHSIIGRLVKYSIENGIEIKEMSQPELNRFSDKLVKNEIFRLFNPRVSVESKRSIKR